MPGKGGENIQNYELKQWRRNAIGKQIYCKNSLIKSCKTTVDKNVDISDNVRL